MKSESLTFRHLVRKFVRSEFQNLQSLNSSKRNNKNHNKFFISNTARIMARPRKNNAEWFSHDTELRNNRKVKAVRQRFWLEWYSIFLMILEVLTDAEDFKILYNESEIDLLSGDFDVDTEKLEEVLNFFLKIWLLQISEWYILNNHLIERLSPLIAKRSLMRQKYESSKVPKKKTPAKQPEWKTPKRPKMTEEQFQQFWSKYPLKQDKAKSQKKFLSLYQEQYDEIIAWIDNHKQNSDKRKKWFIPLPTTFLNGERRKDENFITANTNGQSTQTNWNQKNGQLQRHNESQSWKVSESWSSDIVIL